MLSLGGVLGNSSGGARGGAVTRGVFAPVTLWMAAAPCTGWPWEPLWCILRATPQGIGGVSTPTPSGTAEHLVLDRLLPSLGCLVVLTPQVEKLRLRES